MGVVAMIAALCLVAGANRLAGASFQFVIEGIYGPIDLPAPAFGGGQGSTFRVTTILYDDPIISSGNAAFFRTGPTTYEHNGEVLTSTNGPGCLNDPTCDVIILAVNVGIPLSPEFMFHFGPLYSSDDMFAFALGGPALYTSSSFAPKIRTGTFSFQEEAGVPYPMQHTSAMDNYVGRARLLDPVTITISEIPESNTFLPVLMSTLLGFLYRRTDRSVP